MTLLSMSELKVLRQQQAFLQNHAKTILFLLVYVLKNCMLKFSLLEFTNIF